jgi:hypothetical protein
MSTGGRVLLILGTLAAVADTSGVIVTFFNGRR